MQLHFVPQPDRCEAYWQTIAIPAPKFSHRWLKIMQDESNPDFVAEVVELYFEDSAGKLDKLEGKLAAPTPDFNDIDQLVHQFKGSSASFGAQKLAALCVQVRLLAGRMTCNARISEEGQPCGDSQLAVARS